MARWWSLPIRPARALFYSEKCQTTVLANGSLDNTDLPGGPSIQQFARVLKNEPLVHPAKASPHHD